MPLVRITRVALYLIAMLDAAEQQYSTLLLLGISYFIIP
jgi:hypothetical protein